MNSQINPCCIGVDITPVSRIEKSLSNPRFLTRVFSDAENELLRERQYSPQVAAANYAAKEAFSKALGTGVRGFSLGEVSVLRNKLGAPYLHLEGEAKRFAGGRTFLVSLTHDGGNAIAFVVGVMREETALPELSEERLNRLAQRFGRSLELGTPITPSLIRATLKPRKPDSHKGTYGRLLCVAGSTRFRGAAALCTEAALRGGAGIVCLASVEPVLAAASSSLKEPVLLPLKQNEDGGISSFDLAPLKEELGKATAVLAGCGLSNTEDTQKLIQFLLKNADCPLILDADGLNVLPGCIDIIRTAKRSCIITPHVGEMSRLCGKTVAQIKQDPVLCAAGFAKEYGCTVVLKDADTVVAAPDGRIFFNTTGNAGMAKGGSGDILAGLIGSFLAQGTEAALAAACAVYLHGAAGDLAAEHRSQYAMLPSDLIGELPVLLRSAGL